jgi:valyl-tRNA synthetase
MKGIPVVWIPGLDHAGIATQLVVEKLLWAKERKTRHDLSREELLSRVNEWKNSRSDEIREQLLKLGASLDFDQEFFTLSETMSEAVNEAFIRLFNNNLIYRDSLLVNWSFFLQSTISDIEVKYQELKEMTANV